MHSLSNSVCNPFHIIWLWQAVGFWVYLCHDFINKARCWSCSLCFGCCLELDMGPALDGRPRVSWMDMASWSLAENIPSLCNSRVTSLTLILDTANPLHAEIRWEHEIHQIVHWKASAIHVQQWPTSVSLTFSCNKNSPGYQLAWASHAGCQYQPLRKWSVGPTLRQQAQLCFQWMVQLELLVPGLLGPPLQKSSLKLPSGSIWVEVVNIVLRTLGHALEVVLMHRDIYLFLFSSATDINLSRVTQVIRDRELSKRISCLLKISNMKMHGDRYKTIMILYI